tara:strand:- start:657 stop:1106 length:450 start_codon:yes stop_codon:yes gene_type:complete
MQLNIETEIAELVKGIKIDKEGKGDDEISRVDLKFRFTAESSILEQLLLTEKPEGIFWRRGRLIPGLKKIPITTSWKFTQVFFGEVQCDNCTIRNVALAPQESGQVVVTLLASFRNPTGKQLATLAKRSDHSLGLKIISAPDLFDVSDD